VSQEFTERRIDYSQGRKNAPELIVCIGLSGCGKSTWATTQVNQSRGTTVRFNKDDMRTMMYRNVPYGQQNALMLIDMERDLARGALQRGLNVIVDDTNCIRRTRQGWEEFAAQMRCKLRLLMWSTDAKTCIERDKGRGEQCSECGRAKGVMVGEGVIRKQQKDLGKGMGEVNEVKPVALTRPYFERTEYLPKGGWTVRLPGSKWVLVDMDGTLASHVGVRGAFDESRVLEDKLWEPVAEEIRRLYPTHNVCVMSGRHDSCGDDTCDWMEMHAVPFDHILMRYSGDNRSDVIVKQELLNELAAVVGKENIAVVIDDRPRVVEMWRSNGLVVRQVYAGEFLDETATTRHADGCAYESQKGYRRCPDCGALEDY
jgi:predicted kinase